MTGGTEQLMQPAKGKKHGAGKVTTVGRNHYNTGHYIKVLLKRAIKEGQFLTEDGRHPLAQQLKGIL